MGEFKPGLDLDNLHLTAEEAAARAAADPDVDEASADVDTDIARASVALKDAAVHFGAQVKETLGVTNAFISRAVKDSPLKTLGGAAGAGFVVGGGLSAPLTRSMLRVGLKAGGAFFLDAAIKTLTAATSETRTSRRATSSEESPSVTSTNNGETP
jgi:hypothetical protein